MAELKSIEQAMACVHWLGGIIEPLCPATEDEATAEKGEPSAVGIFRLRPSDSTVAKLKVVMGKEIIASELDGERSAKVYLMRLKSYAEENEEKYGMAEIINGVASLLKGYLRDLNKPLLPFDFCVEDLAKYSLDAAQDEERKEIGATLAKDLIESVVVTHASSSANVIKVEIEFVCKLFALLCSVSRVAQLKMSSYDLFVPFLPSICGTRGDDPSVLMAEHSRIKQLNSGRRACEAQGVKPPQTRLEVCIIYGRRIWGFVKANLASLEEAVEAVREFEERSSSVKEEEHHRRKRDIIMRIFKPHRWRSGSSSSSKQRKDSATGVVVPPPEENSQQEERAAYSFKVKSAFRQDALLQKKMSPSQALSVRLNSQDIAAQLEAESQLLAGAVAQPSMASGSFSDSTAELGKALFRQATSD